MSTQTKDTFSILNDISVDLTEYDSKELSEVEKRRIKNQLKKKLSKKKYWSRKRTMVSIIVLSLMYISIQTNALALTRLPLIGGIISEYLGINKATIETYKTNIGDIVSDSGIDVRLDEVLIDSGQLIVSSTFHSNKFQTKDITSVAHPKIYLNDEEFYSPGGSMRIKPIDESTFVLISAIDLKGINIEGNVNLDLIYNRLSFLNGESFRGNWAFKIQTSGENLFKESITIQINKSFTLENGQEITVKDIELSPVSTKLNYEMTLETNIENKLDVLFLVEDQNGKELKPVSGTSMARESHLRLGLIDEEVTHLEITPYVISGEEGIKKTNFRKVLYNERFKVKINKR